MIKIFTIIGLVLQFLAFWMAAPEILGVDWLKRTETMIRLAIAKIPQLILGIIGIVSGMMFYHSMSSTLIFATVVMLVAIMLIFYKKMEKSLDEKISKPLIDKLILNNTFRFTLLKYAALFFTIGFVIQILLVIVS
ncbi:hypothetical protein [Empedobacter sedimenti]|uniref:hypothetical protein n=1 Tax=Empedobacter sedimenti TaxID=3042610 RepID=UPI0024A6360E|nr:hypothetical protein [Empedobacter sedimenti]